MKYLIKPGTELFEKFKDLKERIKAAVDASYDFIKEQGATEGLAASGRAWGGCAGLKMASMPPGWRNVSVKGRSGVYYPRKTKENAGIIAKFESLPTVQHSEISEMLNYGFYTYFRDGQMYVTQTPGVDWDHEGGVLITVADEVMDQYTPVLGMVKLIETVTYTEEPVQ